MSTISLSRAALRPLCRLSKITTGPLSRNLLSSTQNTSKRSFVSATSVLLEKKTMKLPGLGDSITEGTVVEWTAAVGQAVKEGDVVALVETDKVTVDIKAEMDGVVTQQFMSVDDTIEVGQDLYEIDTEAEASVSTSDSSSPTEAKMAEAEPEPQPASTPAAETEKAAASETKLEPAPAAAAKSHRTPSIHFLGKEGWARKLAGEQTPQVVYIPPSYGRPAFTEEEMEALVTGGANLAPQVKDYSSGAMFG